MKEEKFQNPGLNLLKLCLNIRVIRKVRKTQHQNPEFGHTQDEIKKNVQRSSLAFNGG
jgi:hypothetical protein